MPYEGPPGTPGRTIGRGKIVHTITQAEPIGPNVKKLIFHYLSKDVKNFADGIRTIQDLAKDPKKFSEAQAWVENSIRSIKNIQGKNPYKDMNDEEIAGAILAKVEEKRKSVGGK